jgi:hypothetical protein
MSQNMAFGRFQFHAGEAVVSGDWTATRVKAVE